MINIIFFMLTVLSETITSQFSGSILKGAGYVHIRYAIHTKVVIRVKNQRQATTELPPCPRYCKNSLARQSQRAARTCRG